MQLSEIYGEAIVLPKSKAASTMIELGLLNEDLYDECYHISLEHILDVVSGSGLLDQINKSCSTHIGFFEQEEISPEKLPLLVSAIRKAHLKIQGPIIQTFCDELETLCLMGIERGLPIYFVS